jgi:hypothetical protein
VSSQATFSVALQVEKISEVAGAVIPNNPTNAGFARFPRQIKQFENDYAFFKSFRLVFLFMKKKIIFFVG